MEKTKENKEKTKILNKNNWKKILKCLFIISCLIKYNFKNLSEPLNILISELNKNKDIRKPKYILLFDYLPNKYCYDHNSYLIFQYYQERNKTDVYYMK